MGSIELVWVKCMRSYIKGSYINNAFVNSILRVDGNFGFTGKARLSQHCPVSPLAFVILLAEFFLSPLDLWLGPGIEVGCGVGVEEQCLWLMRVGWVHKNGSCLMVIRSDSHSSLWGDSHIFHTVAFFFIANLMIFENVPLWANSHFLSVPVSFQFLTKPRN